MDNSYNLRLFISVLAAKMVIILLKILRPGKGSSLPGQIALRICPDLLRHFAQQPRYGTVMTTGTNGKTTTNNMIAGILEYGGHQVISNREGANLMAGLATVYTRSCTLFRGRIDCDFALLEVDEAALPQVTDFITPVLIVVTNFFQDQLDRYGDVDATISKVLQAIRKLSDHSVLVLNADDPKVAGLAAAAGHECLFYGLQPTTGFDQRSAFIREAAICPVCGQALKYDLLVYEQLGHYSCSHCSFSRPRLTWEIRSLDVHTDGISIIVKEINSHQECPIEIPLQGLHNLYNAVAAFTAANHLGVDPQLIRIGLLNYLPVAGRMEYFRYKSKQVVLSLVKNATGFDRTLEGLSVAIADPDVFIAINDQPADGRDVSWLWDVDFESFVLKQKPEQAFFCSGQRAADVALRLKYAGVSHNIIHVEPDLQRALDLALAGNGQDLCLLVNYTALLPVEKGLLRRAERMKKDARYNMSSVS